MANTISLKIDLEGADALKTIKALEKGVTGLGKSGTKSIGGMTNAMQVFKGVVGAQVLLRGLDLVGRALKQGAKDAIAFGGAIAEINSIAPRTVAETGALKNALLDLSNEFGGSAQKNAKAFYNIVSAGVKGTAKQLSVLAIANKAAVAGLVDIDTSAKVLVSSVNSYAKSGLTAQQASDILFTTVKEGITTFGELSNSIGTVAPLAAAAGLTFAELGGALAFITKGGVSTAEAATGIRATLTSIIKPAEQAAKFAKQIGLEFSTTALKAKGFAAFMKDVAEKTGGTTENLAKLFPNVRALGAVIQITNGDFEDFQRILGETAGSIGATDKAFKTITDSAEFQFNKLTNQLSNFPIAILTNFEGPISDALKTVNKFVSTQGILLIVDAVDSIINAFDAMQIGVANTKVALAAIASAAAELGIQWTELALAVIGAVQATQRFLGLDVSESLKEEEEALKSRIAGLKEFQQAQEDGAIAEIQAAEKTSQKVQEFRAKIAESRAAEVALADARREEELSKDKDQAKKQLEILVGSEQVKADTLAELREAQSQIDADRKEEELLGKELEAEEEFQFLADNLGKENALRELHRISQIDDEKKRIEETKKLKQKADKEDRASIFSFQKFENLTNKEKISAQKATLGAISALSQSSNATLFAIGKAASLTNAGINIAEGVTKALSAFPPPFNFVAAAAVGAAGAINIAKIASAKKPSAGSFAHGGIVDGASQTGDQLTANVNGGEAIFNRRQQQNLFNAVDTGAIGGGGGDTNISIQSLTGDIPQESIDNLMEQLEDAQEFRNRSLIPGAA